MKDKNYSITLSVDPELNSKMDYLVRKSITSLNELIQEDKIILTQLREYLKLLQHDKEGI